MNPDTRKFAHHWQAQDAAWQLRLSGDWRGAAGLILDAPPAEVHLSSLRVDAAEMTHWDGALAAVLRERLAPLARRGVALDVESLPNEVRAVLALALPQPGQVLATPALPAPALERLGLALLDARAEARITLTFIGEVLLALLRLLQGRSTMRFGDLMRQIDQTGPLSIPIVTLTCSLVGLMLAYMGGAQLERLGAQAYIADIVTVGMVREMAGLMTGMILTGRVGASFAAQLATMKAGEEIDALRALGVDPVDHLVMPRLLALVCVAPLILAYASAVGVLAGMIPASLIYGSPASEYLVQAQKALTWDHLWIGLFKGTLYAALLGLAGCREGLQAGRDALAVGQATTTAVVKGLVWIIVAACATTVLFQSMGL